jgi:hypothetical protein
MYSELKKNIAKRPEATRNITTFAAVSERVRKIDRRTSGAVARSSMKTKPTSRIPATTNVPIVCAEPQPFCCAWTIAYTSAIRPPVTETAPATSNDRCAASSRDSGISRSESRKTTMPTGTLMKKIHGHEKACVIAPPRTRPTALPPIAIAAHTPSAFARSAPSLNVVEMIASAAGEMNAAPRPCSARAAISEPSFCASPSSSDAMVKTTRPARKKRFRPSRSPTRPPRSRKPPKTSVYALTIHWRFASDMCRSL